jgi:hypothetical protein
VNENQVPGPLPDWSQGPTDTQAVDGGGWDGRYARVVGRAIDGRAALVVVDSNGAGSELEADAWQYTSGRWKPGNSSGIGSVGATGNESSGRSGQVVWAAGLRDPGTGVSIRYGNDEQRVVADANGLWVWVREDAGPTPNDDWPEVS